MHIQSLVPLLSVVLLATLPHDAWADRVVLSPLMAQRGVSDEQVANLFSLMSSELEFMENVDEVIELNPRPPALDDDCLESARCLKAVTKEAGGETLITGTLESLGGPLGAHLYYFDARTGKLIRDKIFEIPADASGMINHISPVLVETITGVNPHAADKKESLTGVSFSSDDTLAFAPPSNDAPPATTEPEPTSEPASTRGDFFVDDELGFDAPPPEPSSETRVVNRAIQLPEPPPSEPEPTVNDSNFGTTFTFGDVSESEIGDPPPADNVDPYDSETPYLDEEPYPAEPAYNDGYAMDEPPPREADRRDRKPKSKSSDKGEYSRVYISVRGGMANYYAFNFGAIGAEIGVRATGGLTIVAGINVLIVRRASLDGSGNQVVLTNMLYPANLGIIYRFLPGKFQPYAGIDASIAKILKDPISQKAKFGFAVRARGGLDYFFTKNFGFNLDVGLGIMIGDSWPQVDARQKTVGFYPTGQLGFTFAF